MKRFHICLHVLSNVLALFCVGNAQTPFVRTNSTRLPHLETIQMASRVMCCGYCKQLQDCNSVNFNMLTMECQISVFSFNEVNLHGIADGNWENYATLRIPICKNSNWLNNAGNVTNVAVGKQVTLSSTFTGSSGSLLVDGVRKSTWPCAGTNPTSNPYMVVDLLYSYAIKYMYILNRSDCCSQRLHDLDIWVGNTSATLELAVHIPGLIGADCLLALPPATYGRYVKLQIITPAEYFTVCELEVYV